MFILGSFLPFFILRVPTGRVPIFLWEPEKRTKKRWLLISLYGQSRKNGQIIHQESKTFSKKSHAKAYGKKRVNELKDLDYLKKVQHSKFFPQQGTVATLIQKYIKEI